MNNGEKESTNVILAKILAGLFQPPKAKQSASRQTKGKSKGCGCSGKRK